MLAHALHIILLKCVVFDLVAVPRRDVVLLADGVVSFGGLRQDDIVESVIGNLTVRSDIDPM